jgi:hypothetical protein
MMLRGESTRTAELANLYSVLLPDEGSECLDLVLRTSVGKTIPLALGGNLRMQHYHAARRHRDPVLCPIGALAHWLVLHWEICGETPPDFRRRSSWYTTKVLPGKLSLAQKKISDDTQRTWIVSALEAVAVDSSKAVHAMRPVGGQVGGHMGGTGGPGEYFLYIPSTAPLPIKGPMTK